jgi:phosphomannomutase/phosphoglucomutase
MIIDSEIFRAYDIRGLVDDQLNPSTIYIIGQAIGSAVLATGTSSILTCRDGRISSPSLMHALQQGIISTGCNIIDIGMQPTPVLYFATHMTDCHSGVMLTGSHNPTNYNGLKIVIAGQVLSSEAIQQLYTRIQQQQFAVGSGQITTLAIEDNYIHHILNTIHIHKPFKIVIDAGNGVAGKLAPRLFKALGCEVFELYCDIDGNFPNHHPDPSVASNLQTLIAAVQHHQADVGFAFDGDGDRLGLITNTGEIIWPDRQLALFAKDILGRHPGSTIVYDVKCSKHLTDIIRAHHGVPLMYKTGHSLIKNKMQETGALLSGEMSGHIYFKERWFGFDDGLYTGARLLELLSQTNSSSTELFASIPDSINTPELKLAISEQQKFSFMALLMQTAIFPNAMVHTIDGLRVDFHDGWGLIRPSNTTPYLILRFEADNEISLLRIQEQFRQLLLTLDASLQLPF